MRQALIAVVIVLVINNKALTGIFFMKQLALRANNSHV